MRMSGVYRIQCVVSEKSYIGSSKNIKKRWREHLHHLRHGKHHSVSLQRAWDKYGESSFAWSVIETTNDESLLQYLEQEYIDKLGTYGSGGYNTSMSTTSPRGTKHRPETVCKMRERVIEYFKDPRNKEKHSLAQKKRFLDPEQKRLLKESRAGKWLVTPPNGYPFQVSDLKEFCHKNGLRRDKMGKMGRGESEQGSYLGWSCIKLSKKETKTYTEKRRISNLSNFDKRSNLSKKQAERDWILTRPDGTEVPVHGLLDFCEKNGLRYQSMTKVARGINKTHKGWMCRRANEDDIGKTNQVG